MFENHYFKWSIVCLRWNPICREHSKSISHSKMHLFSWQLFFEWWSGTLERELTHIYCPSSIHCQLSSLGEKKKKEREGENTLLSWFHFPDGIFPLSSQKNRNMFICRINQKQSNLALKLREDTTLSELLSSLIINSFNFTQKFCAYISSPNSLGGVLCSFLQSLCISNIFNTLSLVIYFSC